MIEKVLNNTAFLELLEHAEYVPPTLHMIQIPVNLDSHPDRTEITILWIHIQRRLKNTCNNPVYIFAPGGLWKTDVRKPVLAFTNQDDAMNAKQWLSGLIAEFFDWPAKKRKELFLAKDDFDALVASGEPFTVAATIDYKLERFDIDQVIITAQVREVWGWIQDNCRARVWRWDGKFRFENGDDATLFKLTWR